MEMTAGGSYSMWNFLKWIRKGVESTTQWTQMSLGCIQDILKRSRRLTAKPDVVKTSGKRRLIYNFLKTSYLRRLKDVQFTTSRRHLIYDVLRTSDLQRLEDVSFTLSWGRPIYNVFKTSVKRRRIDVYTKSKERIFPYFVLSEIFRKL